MTDVAVLNVLLYGAPIGTLTRVAGDRTLFMFNEDYIARRKQARPWAWLQGPSRGADHQISGRHGPKCLPFFSNLLPEGPLRGYLAARAGVNPVREFFLLWVLGSDLPGAITVVPADGEPWPTAADDHDEHGHDRHENALRFSLAGVQLKFSAVQVARGGLTIPASGVGGSWIVKTALP